MRVRSLVALVSLWLLSACATAPLSCDAAHADSQVVGDGVCLVMKRFPAGTADRPVTTLYVVVHGDGSTPGPSVYRYAVAERLAQTTQQSVAVALLRPGYEDDAGHASEGSSNGHRDNYTATNVAVVAGAVRTLRARYPAARVIGVGHSGGAATLALIAGRHPAVLDAMVLVSCPCDVPRWRGGRGGAWPNSLSPQQYAAGVPDGMQVRLLTGTADTNTGAGLAQDYADSLAARGIDARFTPVPGESHNGAFRSPLVIAAATELAR